MDDGETRPVDDPRLERELDFLLAGSAVVKSYEGTSQYTKNGISACGLASFQAVKTILELEKNGVRGLPLLRRIMTKELVEDVMKICSSWASPAHLEVEEISSLPLFAPALNLEESQTKSVNHPEFLNLCKLLQSKTTETKSCAAVLTKSPEILAVFAIVTELPAPRPSTVFVVFDSHSRPQDHPDGAAFSLFANPNSAAGYLARILTVDKAVVEDSQPWQAALLTVFEAHIYTAVDNRTNAWRERLDQELAQATNTILTLKSASYKDRLRLVELESSTGDTMFQISKLNDEVERVQRELDLMTKRAEKAEEKYDRVASKLDDRDKRKDDRQRDREKEKDRREASDRRSHHRRESSSRGYFGFLPSVSGILDYTPSFIADLVSEPMRDDDLSDREPGPSKRKAPTYHHRDRADREETRTRKPSKPTKPSNHKEPESKPSRPSNRESETEVKPTKPSSSSRQVEHASAERGRDREADRGRNHRSSRQNHHSSSKKPARESQDTDPAAKMQANYDRERRKISKERKRSRVEHRGPFDCGICFQTYPESEIAKFDGCKHLFCRECLAEHISFTLMQPRFPVLCPVCVIEPDVKEKDAGVVTLSVIEIAGVSERDFQRWTEYSLSKHSIVIDCRRCRHSSMIDREDYKEAQIIRCPMKAGCDHMWCKICFQTVESEDPEEHSCDGGVEMEKLMKRERWKRCPGCEARIERTEGCNHMLCGTPGCNTHFCYIDGQLIVQSQNNRIIAEAVQAHYSRGCQLFDVPPE